MKGYKTYIGLVLIFLGWLGLADIISEAELTSAVDNGIQIFGILMAAYGRYKATK